MAAEYTGKRNYNTQLLDELEALSHSLYHSHTSTSTTRRTASLALPRTSVPPISSAAADNSSNNDDNKQQLNPKPRSRRMSLSPWRSRPKLNDSAEEDQHKGRSIPNKDRFSRLEDQEKAADTSDKKGLWSWKPIRALSHIGMQKLSCLFSVEVVAVQGLPASMNGLRLSVSVRKKETKDGAVQTMPSRVQQGAADFEETLFIRCHVYFTPGSGTHVKFEPRPFVIYVFAVDAGELDFGRSSVDLSHLIQDSIEKSFQGTRVKQWDTSFNLSGKAKGGELVLKLGFQIMEKDGGIGIYTQAEGQKSGKNKNSSSSIARKQSKSSFSVPSPKLSSRAEAWSPSQTGARADLQDIDDLNLDDPAPAPQASPPSRKSGVPDAKIEDDLLDFEVVDKGVEFQEDNNGNEEEALSEENSEKRSVSREVVKEIVHEQFHLTRLSELDSIAQRIKALESMMKEEKAEKTDDDTESQKLDAEEETVTREFLQMLEDSEGNEIKKLGDHDEIPQSKSEGDEDSEGAESKVYIPDLGKGLGCIVQTRNGGYLAAMNPLDTAVARKDAPKLAMQMSRPVIVPSKATTGFELVQRMAAVGFDELGSGILSLMPMDELKGKTAEQIAFEGIASAIIQGRKKEGASSSAARTLASVKSMATALSTGRQDRISTGIWNLSEDPVVVDEILAFSMQKLEVMAVEALKVQADIGEEEAPFEVSPLSAKLTAEGGSHPLASAIPIEDWIRRKAVGNENGESGSITIAVVVQLRDPLRLYEAVGGPMIALIHSSAFNDAKVKPAGNYDDEEKMFKVGSLQVGGLKGRSGGRRTEWDSEKQRLTAMQWLVAYGLGKAAGKKGKRQASKAKGQDILWSISSRVMADMWLKAIRNPDVKFTK
ncbi:protein PLASTID MOVEMENT IMPAIRED 1 [Coffea eugenioides]|uniref:protein PLASTID MOVEMENT IMPAIRED 1 n=1 Tax=Coffea eugenioides TaxID=49369 RepID=UPI000F6053F9|nr:protein PLASTID MOVEMENT IMPAIRED 1 [Coffea eugenioides]